MSNKLIDLYYSVLEYIPSSIRGEKINVGIVFHTPNSNQKLSFSKLKSMQRVASFDDENIEFYKIMMLSLEDVFTFPKAATLDQNIVDLEYAHIDSKYFLEEKTKYYNNMFQFKPVFNVQVKDDELDTYKHDLERTYLYYDRPKNERITTTEVRRLLSHQINVRKDKSIQKVHDLEDSLGESNIFNYQSIYGDFILPVGFDYKSDANALKELRSILYSLDSSLAKNPKISQVTIVVSDTAEDSLYYQKFRNELDIISNRNDKPINIKFLSQVNE